MTAESLCQLARARDTSHALPGGSLSPSRLWLINVKGCASEVIDEQQGFTDEDILDLQLHVDQVVWDGGDDIPYSSHLYK
jgi:hypothetical protein